MLSPCPACNRHVHAGEPRCPFCDGALDEAASARRSPRTRLDRAALVAFGALAGAAACGEDTTVSSTDATTTATTTTSGSGGDGGSGAGASDGGGGEGGSGGEGGNGGDGGAGGDGGDGGDGGNIAPPYGGAP